MAAGPAPRWDQRAGSCPDPLACDKRSLRPSHRQLSNLAGTASLVAWPKGSACRLRTSEVPGLGTCGNYSRCGARWFGLHLRALPILLGSRMKSRPLPKFRCRQRCGDSLFPSGGFGHGHASCGNQAAFDALVVDFNNLFASRSDVLGRISREQRSSLFAAVCRI